MLPEISRRCRSCGAAVRAGARFCPQCGAVMGEEPSAAAAPETREVEPARDRTPPTGKFTAFAQSLEGEGAPAPESGARPEAAPAVEPRRDGDAPPRDGTPSYVAAVASHADADEGDGVDATAASGAPGARGRVARVRDGTRARVGRMREEAIVVLEETPDDSGLRFVVAAAALFAVFVILLFLSTTVLR
ncbi:MAG: zinc-ribbon domain-containing protein [Acidobacteria bacterium]|nr:zinc-ribbon domain-containing protein [Acidobacteriota bacterium]